MCYKSREFIVKYLGDQLMTIIFSEKIVQSVIDVIVEITGIPPEKIDSSEQLYDLGIDSIEIITIISDLQVLYNIKIIIEDLFRNSTVKGIAGTIQAKVNNKL